MTACDWAACDKPAATRLDGWFHCTSHTAEHIALHRVDPEPTEIRSLVQARADRTRATLDTRARDLKAARELIAAGVEGWAGEDLTGRGQAPELVAVRHRLMLHLHLETSLSLVQIGKLFGRHHTTVLVAVRNLSLRMQETG